MPRVKQGNPRRSLRRSSHAGRSKAVSMAQCLLPRDLGNTAASEAPDLATACTVFPVPTEDGHAMHVGEAQHCGLLWERTPAPPPRLVFVPTILRNPLHPRVSPRCGRVRADACPQRGCPPKRCAGWVMRPFAWQQPQPPRQPEHTRCRTSSIMGDEIACIAASARG